MRALVYNGPRDVQIKNVPDAKIEKATDVLVKITTTNICVRRCPGKGKRLCDALGYLSHRMVRDSIGGIETWRFGRHLWLRTGRPDGGPFRHDQRRQQSHRRGPPSRPFGAGRAKPSWIISHELSLDDAPDAYRHFDRREKGWTKVILHPQGRKAGSSRHAASETKPERELAHAE